MRVAVVGLGRMGRFYAQAVAALGPTVRLAAIVEPDARVRDRVQACLEVEHAVAEPAAALERRDIDAVIVATPSRSHAEIVIAAAHTGKAILCEKPLALTVEQTRAALQAVQRSGSLLQVGFMRRFDAAYERARAAIQAGAIGRPLTFSSIGRDPRCPEPGYADPANSGGLLVDMAIHDFDLARWLMSSEVERVFADGAVLACEDLRRVGDIDTALVQLRFASGALGSVEVSRTARYGYDIRTEVVGSEGVVRVGEPAVSAAAGVELVTALPAADDVPHLVRRFCAAESAQHAEFLRCVREDRPPRADGHDALAAIELAEAAARSLQTGTWVSVSDFEGARHG
jgi:predicted dehydrogenase